ncbi:aldo-keto reductase superfamily protein SCDLUD_000312 [Saccharomycodes ludwigii]|uniref:aldo-keto reductase superfamily protein n=1 Tax=Saccharomycodes ludwigii TaxID=36035 RepID=UPI001E86B507|nr:hypothetical protein SCDLUD_000312 [Saccharomycodes ludwigii]KAH3902726.1 hypothetical protein SCDLUD_000312 [Saccharomycodes ludwigii]
MDRAIHQEFFTLNNGNKIPGVAIIGTGTKWFKKVESEETFSKELVEQIKYALTLPGIVHIDAAEIYRTYPEIGAAIEESRRKPRNQIWITDKYSTSLKITENPKVGLETSLKKMGVEYVDLYLLHSPFVTEEKNGFSLEQAWKYLEELYKNGKAKNIGVSNFGVKDLERILKVAEIKPQVNQIEYSAFLQNQTPGIYKFAREHDILLEAYSPLGPLTIEHSEDDEFYRYIKELSHKYDKTEAQILLRWVADRHVLPVTTSGKKERIEEAQYLYSFDLTYDESNNITQLGLQHKPLRKYWTEQYSKYDADSQKSDD